MDKIEVYNIIRAWETDAGESFLDRGFDLHELTFMTWCLGRGYISKEKYNNWSRAYLDGELEATDANYYVFSDDVDFAVVVSEELDEKDREKAFMILSEFISEIDIYVFRLKEFIRNN